MRRVQTKRKKRSGQQDLLVWVWIYGNWEEEEAGGRRRKRRRKRREKGGSTRPW
jgi:hypothetical protein